MKKVESFSISGQDFREWMALCSLDTNGAMKAFGKSRSVIERYRRNGVRHLGIGLAMSNIYQKSREGPPVRLDRQATDEEHRQAQFSAIRRGMDEALQPSSTKILTYAESMT